MIHIKTSICLLMSIILLSACATSLEHVNADFNSAGWKVGYSEDVRGKGNIVEYIPSMENIESWSKMMTIQFAEGVSVEPALYMGQLKAKMQARCPNVAWSIIEEGKNHILYEWKISDCGNNPAQHEIAKIMKGNDGLHRFAYVEKTEDLSASSRKLWIDRIASSYLKKGDARVVVQE